MHASIQKSVSVVVESLESRQMMSAGPLASQLNATSHNGQAQLQIFGTAKSDSIFVTTTAAGVKVTMNGKVQTVAGTFDSIYVHGGRGNDAITLHSSIKADAIVYGGHGDDTLAGGAGNDKFYGQAGNDSVHGGAGDDVIVSIGDSTTDKATGGLGFDSFWVDQAETVTDASLDETAGGNVHRVANFNSFATTRKGAPRALRVGVDLNGGDLADPIADGATYQSFATNRLFADAGPSADDVAQGYVGDCWFLATLSSVARTNQNAIRQSIVELGDGTFAVQFANPDGSKAFVRVDADLPVSAWGGMEYAQLGAQDSVWVAVMEKAYATFRNAGPANYAQLDGGWMSEACDDLGFASDDFWSITSGETLFDLIAGELAAGQAVTIAINQPQNGARLIGYHAYDVVSIDTDEDGTRTLVVRNPWGIDGVGSDGANDGYVRLSALQAISSYWAFTSAKVA